MFICKHTVMFFEETSTPRSESVRLVESLSFLCVSALG